MKVLTTIKELRETLAEARKRGDRIGFVPTMGALHEGHLSLIDAARKRAESVVVSIFVNPLQFGEGEDLARYPRDLKEDAWLCESRGAAAVFAPSTAEMYPERITEIQAPGIGEQWEGKSRPGHFTGVLTVVAKLFNIVQPDVAVFGQKDLQQAAIVGSMVRDLNIPLEFVVEPTVRDKDGLALSSRNRFLSETERSAALALPGALTAVRAAFENGVHSGAELEELGRSLIEKSGVAKVDYLAVVDPRTFQRMDKAATTSAVIAAVQVGKTRLIDNMLFTP